MVLKVFRISDRQCFLLRHLGNTLCLEVVVRYGLIVVDESGVEEK